MTIEGFYCTDNDKGSLCRGQGKSGDIISDFW